jgi:taurine dioxygenase
MAHVTPSGASLGCSIEGMDLARPLSDADVDLILRAFGRHGVLCFPKQSLTPEQHKAFAARFGSLEINVAAGHYTVPGHPDVMILSNIVENGKALGLADAGQDWHTDMSYSSTVAFLNVLHGLKIPHRDGRPLGATVFADMCAAYDELPAELKKSLSGKTATHDFAKFWDMMRQRPGSTRGPLTPAQRAAKPPVSQPIFLEHPISGRKALYCSVGYVTHIDGMPKSDSDAILKILFEHQLREKYQYAHHWSASDVLVWDNLWTMHNAVADYGPNEHRLVRRCQVMADWIFTSPQAKHAAARFSSIPL